MKKNICFPVLTALLVGVMITAAGVHAAAIPQKTIVVLPFDINTSDDISHVTSGILRMLETRLTWEGKIRVLSRSQTARALSDVRASSEIQALMQIGNKTGADFIITGTVTQFSGAVSVDTKVYNLADKSFLTFFGQAKTIDRLVSQVDVVAAKINKKVFERTTVSFEKFEKEKIITEEELRRMNPERMMPMPGTLIQEEKPWWKFW